MQTMLGAGEGGGRRKGEGGGAERERDMCMHVHTECVHARSCKNFPVDRDANMYACSKFSQMRYDIDL